MTVETENEEEKFDNVTIVKMVMLATNVQLTDKQRDKGHQEEEEKRRQEQKNVADDNEESEPDTSIYKKLEVGMPVIIEGKEYKVQEIINENNGHQAVIFQNPRTKKSVYAVAGSFPLKEPFANFKEWFKDWIMNNLIIGFGVLPPQLETAQKNLDKYKDIYNIENVAGYSLGGILTGLMAKFKRNKNLNFYSYNGGLVQKLNEPMLKKYDEEIELSAPTNLQTYLADNEFLTNLISVNMGAVMQALRENTKPSSHSLANHVGKKPEDYVPIVSQTGMGFADTLAGSVKATENGGLEFGISFSPTLGNEKVKAEDSESSNPIKDVRYIKRLPKNKSKKFKPLTPIKPLNNKTQDTSTVDTAPIESEKHLQGNPTGGAAPIESEIACRNDYEKELVKKLAAEYDEDYLGIVEAFRRDISRLDPNSTLIPRFEKSHKICRRKYIERGLAQYRMQAEKQARLRQLRNARPQKSRAEMAAEFEDYFRNVLDDFIIRMGFEMHDYT